MHELAAEGEGGNWKQIVVDHIPLDDCFVDVVESSLFEKENSDILSTHQTKRCVQSRFEEN